MDRPKELCMAKDLMASEQVVEDIADRVELQLENDRTMKCRASWIGCTQGITIRDVALLAE